MLALTCDRLQYPILLFTVQARFKKIHFTMWKKIKAVVNANAAKNSEPKFHEKTRKAEAIFTVHLEQLCGG